MYSAIVFLPLIGAIIAGAITALGAAARHPEGRRLGTGHGHHAHATVARSSHHDDGHHDHHGPGAAEYITTGALILSAILSWVAFFTVGLGEEPVHVQVMPWVVSGDLAFDWAFRIDTLTVVMLVVVTTVSSLVHVYSIGYMSHDAHRPRFFAYLSLFTFAMLMLVTADNLVQLFFGWEGVGLASYLLIGFWYTRPSANAAAIKAFVVNRVGDFGFSLGIFAVFLVYGSVNFEVIFANAADAEGMTLSFLGGEFDALTVICLLLFMGAMGKSAQFLLHTWLPDAMEGPTPVSALIHAATMVTAGVFMVTRLSPLFELAPTALAFVTFIGATTALFAATIGLVQNDIKRVIAYSTCSQLGYMFVAIGVGAYGAAIFHLFTHAFFKALLFLGSGSVIHAMSDEQDMRRMGGLRKHIPLTYWMMVIGTLALTGFPFTAGFISKDAIIESAFAAHGTFAVYAFALTLFAAALTSFYSWRLIFMTFHGKPRASADVMHHVHESPLVMTVPLMILAVGALFSGLAFQGLFIGEGYEDFWKQAIFLGSDNDILHEMHEVSALVVWSPTVAMIIGFGLAYLFYIRRPSIPVALAKQFDLVYLFLLNKWYFDELYDLIFVKPSFWLGRVFWKKGDGWLIDGFGPDGISARVLDVTRQFVRLQTGYLYHYAFAMLVGVTALITWYMFAGGAH
ncbi:NADH-quinone oxidoreductase subunit L [Lutibaculum baratangense]|uniref:NADH-ubiquinone oxidoreductase chain L n=1 Tax=Lutibaculum baratangense AMV1 TaxID=631454 RepID=V4TG74_9HYPH|nr:NADH-quinone oxidoreductase subunit L [Lutibaculum baratangense]ESR25123.1 NADH-ubiquinone oxidoreductase chain L [Lutibaculum baratangense AMV1]